MSFNDYYQDELSALRQLGRRFSERNPALAPFLGQAGRDPDVERLLEGFAFLTGRLRQKLDDELPELTHSLMNLLWPNYLRPLPSVSMLQFEPLLRSGPAVLVDRSTPVESDPVDGRVCRFRTCFATEVLPLELKELRHSSISDGATLKLFFVMSCEGHIGELELKRVRLHLAGDRYVSQALYLALMRKLEGVTLSVLDAEGRLIDDAHGSTIELDIPVTQVQPVGFAEEEALIPYPFNTFRGYRYLQEYFFFQEKFMFVDVTGLSVLSALPESIIKHARGIQLTLNIKGAEIQRLRPTLDHVKLYCTPIVNLFKQDALPILVDAKRDDYLLVPSRDDLSSCAVYSVDRVTGWQSGGLGYQDYALFESFEHDSGQGSTKNKPFYSARQRPSMQYDGLDTYLSFDHRSVEYPETVSVELSCTNHDLPLQIKAGGICRSCDGTPDFLRFKNITPATPSYAPPVSRDFLWRVISNMSLNYLSLANIDALKVVLETYDLPRYHDQQAERASRHLLKGLESISHRPADRLYKGRPVRGVTTELVINPDGYEGEGTLFLFASVLNEFFALYASLNSFHELSVKSTHGEFYKWTPRMGLQPLL
ncbi:type VI secretion system baseplate subunit TssF [Pseudomonas sp. 20GA0080]|uniref:type VI secretion system baseplate subunit TssF n=1 Tax=Pseudomonas alliivorans TaxID=2810613 RepID=UPI001AE25A56|nr:type VI secretion system baseplate subunit TssF [Pseudomonas alliivorans]MBP0951631.1 type VI secretion system baseplate subunit TssF [Pseudomonas alliivorans]